MAVQIDDLKKTMRSWVSGVTVVTCSDGVQRAGLTASSFTSVSLEPPLILVCLQKQTFAYDLIQKVGGFGVSILGAGQSALSAQFAGFVPLPEGADKFHGVALHTAETGAPLLSDALAWLDCRLVTVHDAGGSGIIIGEVVATGQQADGYPLAYHNRGYFDLTPQS